MLGSSGAPNSRKEYELRLHLLVDEAESAIRKNPAQRAQVIRKLRKDITALDASYAEVEEERKRRFEEEAYFQRTGVRRGYPELMRLMRTRIKELKLGVSRSRLGLGGRELRLLDEKAKQFIELGLDMSLLED